MSGWVAPSRGAFGEATGAALLHGFDQLGPGKCISPLADRIGFGNNIGNLESGVHYREANAVDDVTDASCVFLRDEVRSSQDTTRCAILQSPRCEEAEN